MIRTRQQVFVSVLPAGSPSPLLTDNRHDFVAANAYNPADPPPDEEAGSQHRVVTGSRIRRTGSRPPESGRRGDLAADTRFRQRDDREHSQRIAAACRWREFTDQCECGAMAAAPVCCPRTFARWGPPARWCWSTAGARLGEPGRHRRPRLSARHARGRVEVMTGGASAVYGSDAIAGAVNSFSERTSTASRHRTFGQTGESDGETNKVDVVAGTISPMAAATCSPTAPTPSATRSVYVRRSRIFIGIDE